MNHQKIKPSPMLYLLSVALLAAAGGLGVWSVTRLLGGIRKMAGRQIVAPTTTEIVFEKPGAYTISHEHHSIVGGKRYMTRGDISGLKCTLRSKATGQEVAVEPVTYRSTYSLGERHGEGIYSFRIDRSGTYEFQAEYAQGAAGPEVVLGIGRSRALITGIGAFIVGLMLGIILFLGALATAIPTFVIRHIRKRKAAAPPAPPAAPGSPAPPAPPVPPYSTPPPAGL